MPGILPLSDDGVPPLEFYLWDPGQPLVVQGVQGMGFSPSEPPSPVNTLELP